MKKFCEPKIEIVVFENNDVIVTSSGDRPGPEIDVRT